MTVGSLLFVAALAAQSVVPMQGTAAPGGPTDALAEAYYLFLRGRSLEADGSIQDAIAAYREAIALLPGSAELRAELSGLYARQGRAAEAVTEGEAALAIEPGNREANRILGFVRAALADRARDEAESTALMRQAIGHFETALAGGSQDPGAQLTLGRLQLAVGDYAPAITTLRAFLLGQPGYTEGQMLLAEAYEGFGATAEAIGVLEEVVPAAPDLPRAKTWLAELYERADRWDEAAALWADLGQSGPAGMYRLRQATALVNGGQLEAGRDVLVKAAEAAPTDVSAWYLLSQVELRAGDVEAAETAARRILEIDASDPRGPLSLAETQAARGDFDAVVRTLEPRVTDPPPGDLRNGVHARLAGALATALQARGDGDEAVAVLEAAHQRVPGDDDLLYSLGAALERAQRFEDAERTLREVISRDSRHAGALNYLGYMLADRGEKLDESVTLIQRALDLEPANPSFLDSLGWAYFKLERFAEATEPLERAAAVMTDVSIVQDHLGDLYFELERYRDAAAAFDRALAGDRAGIDVAAVTRKRDRARRLAGGR